MRYARIQRHTVYILAAFGAFWGLMSCGKSVKVTTPRLGTNLTVNASVESGDSQPDAWERVAPQGIKPVFEWGSDPNNGRTLKIELSQSGMAGWAQRLKLQPDGWYRMRAMVKTSVIAGRGPGASLVIPQFRWLDIPATRDAVDWTRIEADVVNGGFTSIDYVAALGANGLNTGMAQFDSIEFLPIDNPAFDPDSTREWRSNGFIIRQARSRGYLTSLRPDFSLDAPEFLGSFPTLPYLDAARDHFLGDVAVDVRDGASWRRITTADASMTHQISSDPANLLTRHIPENPDLAPVISVGFAPGSMARSMDLTVVLTNKGSALMEIGSVDLPLPWNNNYCLFDPHDKASQKLLYTRRVAEHKSIEGASSYVLACPMDGTAPMLMVAPIGDQTSLEFAYHEPETIRDQRRGPGRFIHGAWPGLTRVCFASRGVIETQKWTNWRHPHTEFPLAPGESRTFKLACLWLDRRSDVEPTQAALGQIGLRLIPGPAFPIDQRAVMIAFGAKAPVTIEGAVDVEVEPNGKPDGAVVLSFRLEKEGETTVELRDAQGHSARAILYGLRSIDALMHLRSRFIMDKQVYNKSGDPLHGAILCYNNRAGNVLADPNDMWGSGGYEGGGTDAMFLAMKNVTQPARDEIEFLEQYIDTWLIGGIQDPVDYGVAWMVSRPDRKERGYNYIHVLNLYEAMVEGAEIWPKLYRHPADHYIDLWMKTFRAFRQERVLFQDLGLMGRGNITFMPPILRRFGLESDAADVEAEIRQWAGYWCEEPPFPFGSELFFDNTGYESVFFYRDYGKTSKALSEQILLVTEAGRGQGPCWFWNDSDQRWWDAVRTSPKYESFTDFGENCHHYMTGLNGWMLLEAYDRGYLQDEPMPSGLSGIFNSWARVKDDGFAGMCFCPDPSSDNYGLNQFTGDVGLGLWGNLKAARCYLGTVPIAGRIAMGASIEGEWLVPYPGFDHRVRLLDTGYRIDSHGSAINRIRIPAEGILEMRLIVPDESDCRSRVVISGLTAPEIQLVRTPEGQSEGKETMHAVVDGVVVIAADMRAASRETWVIR